MGAVGRQSFVNILAVLFGALLLCVLTIDARIFVPLLLISTVVGADVLLRRFHRGQFRGIFATVLYLFVPTLVALGSALFLQKTDNTLLQVVGALVTAVLYAAVLNAEYLTVDAAPETYETARWALSFAGYLAAFALFTVIATARLPLAAATMAAAVVVFFLCVDMLREQAISTGRLMAYAASVAAVIAQVRWAAYYLAMPDLLAGALLLLTFYVVAGLLQEGLKGLDRRTVVEFAISAMVGLVIVSVVWVVWRVA